MTDTPHILLADIGDVIATIFAILVPVLWILGQAFVRQQGKAAEERRVQRRQARDRAKQFAPRQAADKPRDEVDEFLRRVAQRREGGQAAEIEVLEPERRQTQRRATVERPTTRQPVQRPQTPQPKRLVPQTARAPAGPVRAETPRSLAAEPLLADVVDQAAETHRHSVFDHTLGRLDEGVVPPVPPIGAPLVAGATAGEAPAQGFTMPSTAAAGFAALLADTRNVRTAIVLREILERPEYRW